MRKILAIVCAVGLVGFIVGCGPTEAGPEAAAQTKPAPKTQQKTESKKMSKDALLNPAAATATAPDTYQAKFETSAGDFVIQVHRGWAPNGADRFYNLVKVGYYDDVRFFRVVEGFMVQFGINGDPAVNEAWQGTEFPDDPVTQSNTRGKITFATRGPNTRTTQVFINFVDRNKFLDGQGFSPFGEVVEGMDVVDKLYNGYGEGAPRGRGPHQGRLQAEGNAYLAKEFPKMDYVKKATVLE